ncbi:hypothetical protein EB796_017082 [Bugula neritina]|uniref:Uncharacterized protein n=1 Tax=Bugula neritina TaxID=10212 RepID=A0A7J7JGY7_BUGNE|nr:hypothetical protein EB796_017082 [Bugula neritina]
MHQVMLFISKVAAIKLDSPLKKLLTCSCVYSLLVTKHFSFSGYSGKYSQLVSCTVANRYLRVSLMRLSFSIPPCEP